MKRTLMILAPALVFSFAAALAKNPGNIKPPKFDPPNLQAFENEHLPWGYPSWHSDVMIYRDGYSIGYDNEKKSAAWVCYHVRNGYYKPAAGSAKWAGDPATPAGARAGVEDYKKIKKTRYFDKAQLFPADLARGNKDFKAQAFFLSNALPADPALAAGPWKSLNGRIKAWSAVYPDLNVCAGPVFADDDGDGSVEYETLGANRIAVPDALYAVVARYSASNPVAGAKALAFLFPNSPETKKQVAMKYLTTVDRVESVTGLDFFPRLPVPAQAKIESEINLSGWNRP